MKISTLIEYYTRMIAIVCLFCLFSGQSFVTSIFQASICLLAVVGAFTAIGKIKTEKDKS